MGSGKKSNYIFLGFLIILILNITAWKVSKSAVTSGPYFSVLGLNMKIYSVNLRIQSEYRKIRIRNNSVFGHFLCSVSCQQKSFLNALAVFLAIYQNQILIWNYFLVHIFCNSINRPGFNIRPSGATCFLYS